MKSRISPFYSVLAIFLCTALVVEPVVAQVKVYVEGHLPYHYDLKSHLPKWTNKVSSPGEADWMISYEVTTLSKIRTFSKNFLLLFVPVSAIGYLFSVADNRPMDFTVGVYIGSTCGLMLGFGAITAPDKSIKIFDFQISITNTSTSEHCESLSSSRKATTDISRALREMVGDRTAPVLAVANLSTQTRQTIQSPFVNAEISLADDVELSEMVLRTENLQEQIELGGQKSYKVIKPVALDVGDNTLTITVTDLYGRSTSKSYDIFRTRGPAVATVATEKPGTPPVYPSLLSIGEVAFIDESADGFLDAGEGGTLTFHIVNEGKGAANSLRVKVESPQGSGIGVSSLESPPSVSPNSSVQVKYSLIGSATVLTQDVILTISALDQPTQSPAPPVTYRVKTRGRWSDVDLDIPRARRPNPDGVAVIIGNREYKDPGIYPVEFALTDAAAMKKYMMQALGYKEENMIYLQNSSYSDLRSIFGTESDPQGRLHNLIFPDRSDVFIYYSGHGVPGLEDQRGYLLPANVKAEDAQRSGYPLELLGHNLAQLPAKSVTLVVDACFSGQSEEGLLIRDASPVYIEVTDPFLNIKNGNSFFASGGKEIASWFPEQKHGLFTYYFLKGFQGEADANNDKKITVGELEKYLLEAVPYRARRLIGRSQHPVITATEKDRVLVRY